MTLPNIARYALYNLDRLGAAMLGAPPQETVSSQVGRALRAGKSGPKVWLAHALNWIDPGHTERAVKRADELGRADVEVGKW